jgi:hypothetical protein
LGGLTKYVLYAELVRLFNGALRKIKKLMPVL